MNNEVLEAFNNGRLAVVGGSKEFKQFDVSII